MGEKNNEGARREDFFLPLGGDNNKGRVRIDGVDIELPIEQARLVADHQAKQANELQAALDRADQLEAERDAKAQEAKDLQAKLDESDTEETIMAKIQERSDLLERAADYLSDAEIMKFKTNFDAKAIKLACIRSVTPDLDVESKSEAYVDAAFDMLKPRKRSDNVDRMGRILGAKSGERDDRNDLESSIKKIMDKHDNLHKQAIPGGWTKDGLTPGGDALHG